MNKAWAGRGIKVLGAMLLAGALASPAIPQGAQAPAATIVIRGGTIYDGSSAKPVIGDVVIAGDRILYVGPARGNTYRGGRVIDAKGMVVAPGFIDPHTHADAFTWGETAGERLVTPWITQGVTTIFAGSDGHGNDKGGAPELLARTEKLGMGLNVAAYVGFGAVRREVLGDDARVPSAEELARMKAITVRGMCAGALGLSSGLFYAPQSFAKTDEVVAVAREAGIRGGVYDTHQRDESSYTIGLLDSMREAIDIGRKAGMPVHFAHLKALGTTVHGKAPEMVRLVEQARAGGVEVTADQYPYVASGTGLAASLVPRWALDGGSAAMIKRFGNPADRAKIVEEMKGNLVRRGGPMSLMLNAAKRPDLNGKRLGQVASGWGIDPIEAAIRILTETGGEMSVISFNMDEGDIATLMKQPWMSTGSDGSAGHPRMYGTFPEKYAKYVLERKVISLAEFINASTGRTADFARLDRRGHLRSGYFADVVVFDPATYRPRATYLKPKEIATGVRTLVVNGQLAIDGGKITGVSAGRPVRKTPPAGTCS